MPLCPLFSLLYTAVSSSCSLMGYLWIFSASTFVGNLSCAELLSSTAMPACHRSPPQHRALSAPSSVMFPGWSFSCHPCPVLRDGPAELSFASSRPLWLVKASMSGFYQLPQSPKLECFVFVSFFLCFFLPFTASNLDCSLREKCFFSWIIQRQGTWISVSEYEAAFTVSSWDGYSMQTYLLECLDPIEILFLTVKDTGCVWTHRWDLRAADTQGPGTGAADGGERRAERVGDAFPCGIAMPPSPRTLQLWVSSHSPLMFTGCRLDSREITVATGSFCVMQTMSESQKLECFKAGFQPHYCGE